MPGSIDGRTHSLHERRPARGQPLAVKRGNVFRCQQSTTFAVRDPAPRETPKRRPRAAKAPRNRRRPAAVASWRKRDKDSQCRARCRTTFQRSRRWGLGRMSLHCPLMDNVSKSRLRSDSSTQTRHVALASKPRDLVQTHSRLRASPVADIPSTQAARLRRTRSQHARRRFWSARTTRSR